MRNPYSNTRILPPIVRAALLLELGLGGAACLIGWVAGDSPLAMIEWNLSDVGWGLAATAPMLVGYIVCVRAPFPSLRRLTRLVRRIIRPLFRECNWLHLALISAAAGFGEELLFRGLAQSFGEQWFGPVLGLLAASLLFGLAHPLSITYFLIATLIGVYLGFLWMWTDNLLVPIIAHGVYDFVVLATFPRENGK